MRGHHRYASRAHLARPRAGAPSPAHALRTRARPAQRAGAERRRPASTPKPDPATAHHRRHTAAGVLRLCREQSSAPPTRREIGPARAPSLNPNTVSSARRCGAGSSSRRSSNGEHNCCKLANASSMSDSTPTARTTLRSDADATRYSNSAVFPIPASPRSITDRLSPRRIAETKSSINAHSLVRPRKPPGGPGAWRPLSISRNRSSRTRRRPALRREYMARAATAIVASSRPLSAAVSDVCTRDRST